MTKIFIIYTGGTIGMVNDTKTGMLVPFNFEQIKENVPELARLNYNMVIHSFDPIIDSSNMHPNHWKILAELIAENYEEFDGFVILHGSDTMSFTASALSFMLKNLAKPVILTGSQLPIGEIRTDAKENLITALEIAATKVDGKPVVPEVCIFFDNQLFRGNRSIKYNTEKFEAFQSPNYPILAEAGIQLTFFHKDILPVPIAPFYTQTKFEANIGVLKLYPGITPEVVMAVTNAKVKAIVLETFGSGNTATDKWFTAALAQAIDDGKIIVDISQCKRGSVQLGMYQTSSELKKMGVLSGFDMTFEAVVTKLMYLMATDLSVAEIKQQLETSIAGELTN